MFDNPNEELKRLEEQLLQAEQTEREFDRFFGDVYYEYDYEDEPNYREMTDGNTIYDEVPREMETLQIETPEDKGVRNYANGYGKQNKPRRSGAASQNRPVQQRAARPVELEDEDAFGVDESRYVAPVSREKGVKGLVITACLECAGIVGVVLWWVLRIL